MLLGHQQRDYDAVPVVSQSEKWYARAKDWTARQRATPMKATAKRDGFMHRFQPENALLLSQIPLFSQLAPPVLEMLARKLQSRSYKPGEVIFHQGDPGQTFYIIQTGLVKIYLPSEKGEEALLALLVAGEFFGELSLFDGAPRSASAAAIEPTETLLLDREDFLQFLREHPEAGLTVFAVLAARLRRADGIIADAAFLDLQARIAKKLLQLADSFGKKVGNQINIEITVSQQDLGAMVRATRESVNRALATMEVAGLIAMDRRRITILRPDLLQQRFE